MNPPLIDPNNHVPAVSPDDGWDDAEDFMLEANTRPAALPPWRNAGERAEIAVVEEAGLRIDSKLGREPHTNSSPRLEVQEITGTVVRLEQALPSPLKVTALLKFHERPVREKNAKNPGGEGQDWGHASRYPMRWLLGAGGGVGAVVILAMILLPIINAPDKPRTNPNDRTLIVQIEEKIAGIDALNLLLTKQPEATQIYRAYAHARRIDEIMPLLRDGKNLQEILRRYWQPLGLAISWMPAADAEWIVSEMGGHPCAQLAGGLPDGSKFTAYFTNDGNRLLMDWKPTAGFGTASFEQLAQNRGDASEIRGIISIAEYYTASWSEADYQSYRLVSPDGRTIIWCYALRDSLAAGVIAEKFFKGDILDEARSSQKITLRLEHGPAGALANQWLIGEMLHIDWLTP